MHSRCSALPLFFVFVSQIAADAKPQACIALRALPAGVCVARYARCESTTPGHPRGVLHALNVMHVFWLSSPLVPAVSLASSKSSSATWSPLAITPRFVPLLLLVLRLDKKLSLGSSTPYCVIALSRPQLLDGLQALLLCPVSSSC